MQHLTYVTKEEYRFCFLVNKIQKQEIEKEYLSFLNAPKEDILVLDLFKDPTKKKTSTADMKEYLESVKEVLQDFAVEYVVICNSDYYKLFSKEAKSDVNIGYIKEIGHWKVLYCPDYKSIFYDPDKVKSKIKRSITCINDDLRSCYSPPGSLEYTATFPKTVDEIFNALQELKKYPALTADIETFSLKLDKAKLGSITFCSGIDKGIAFQIDPSPEQKNLSVRVLLRDFLESYQGTLIFHNISFDATILIYELWMDDITDVQGLYRGMQAMLKNFEDTKIIAYLATNSCAGNELGLKALAQEFAGNYAQEEISDITKIPLDQLLEYNLRDGLATWFVYNKYRPIMIQDNQLNIYETLFLPSLKDIIQMQLTGFPLSMPRVLEVEKELQGDLNRAVEVMNKSTLVQAFMQQQKERWVEKKNKTLKKKQVTLEDAKLEFNPRSHLQLQELLYSFIGLPVINKTDSNMAATDSSTIESLMNHTENQEVKDLLQAFIDFSAVDKILTAFIPAFKNAVYSPKQDWYFLVGSFNLGGTVSGRLSSSSPNLQNLPATGSRYAKIIKSCFQAPKGWILCGLDFNALEAHIDALVTKDPAKLAVYIHGYDSHMYNAVHYWPETCKDIKLLNEDSSLKGYKCIINGQEHFLQTGEQIELPDGSITTIENAFNLLPSQGSS